jgi:hypothetical protein
MKESAIRTLMLTSLLILLGGSSLAQEAYENPFSGPSNLFFQQRTGPRVPLFPPGGPPQILSVVAPDTLVRPSSGSYIFEIRASVTDPDSIEDVDSVWFYSRDSPNPTYPFHLRYHNGPEWLDTFQIDAQVNLGIYRFVFYARDKEDNVSDSLVHRVVVVGPTSVDRLLQTRSPAFAFFQNYPNPFNPRTTIQFSLPHSEYVRVRVLNTMGELIATVVSEKVHPGTHRVEWDAQASPSGVYFIQFQAGSFSQTRKIILVR